MSPDELSPRARAELDGLDRILAREPIGDEHLELAALVGSVRGQAPRMRPTFAARLDARLAQLPGRRRRVRGRVALAAGGLAAVAAAVALTIVIASGMLDRAAGSQGSAKSPSAVSATAARRGGTPRFSAVQAPGASGGSGARLVRSTATLELATRAPTLLHVADRVVVVTEGQGGTVASSAATVAGGAGRARLRLRVPSGHLVLVIAGLVSLARVRELSEVTSDVTGGYEVALSALARRRSERAALMRKLARPGAGAPALRRDVAHLDASMAADARRASTLDAEARMATVSVAVVATPHG